MPNFLRFYRYMQKDDSKKSIDVNILGQIVRIKHGDEEYVRQLEAFVNEKLKMLPSQQNVPVIQVAIRLVFIIADEYFCILKDKENIHKDIENKAKKMIDFIEQKAALIEDG